jgi:Multiubiquitin
MEAEVDKHLEITINGRKYEVETDDLTGAQIKTLGDIPPGDILYNLVGDHRREVGDTEQLELHNGEKFVSVPRVGGASPA